MCPTIVSGIITGDRPVSCWPIFILPPVTRNWNETGPSDEWRLGTKAHSQGVSSNPLIPMCQEERDHAKRVQPVLPANVFQEMTKKQTGDCNFRSLLVKKINLGKPPPRPTKFCISLVFYFSYAGEMKRKVPCKDLGGKQVGVLWEMWKTANTGQTQMYLQMKWLYDPRKGSEIASSCLGHPIGIVPQRAW